MPRSKDKTIYSLNNKSDKVKEVFAEAANSALSRGLTEEEAVFAGLVAVKNYEKKHTVKKEVKPIPLHLQAVLDAAKERLKLATSHEDASKQGEYQQDLEQVSKAVLEPSKTIVDADFDSQERLVIKFNDGSTITTRPIPRTQKVEQQITVAAPKVVDYLIFDTKANVPLSDRQPGMLTWNELEDCLDVSQADGSTVQLGLEHYVEIYNDNAYPLQNGDVVSFVGVANNELVKANLLTASPTFTPLLLIGVMTNTVLPGYKGRVTVFGKIRNLDTTGTISGEVWQQGDLIWAHPTIAGAMTKVRPSAPNPSISIGVVLKVSSTEGLILVRPTIFPRLFYGKYLSNQTQQPLLANTAYAVTFNNSEIQSGVVIEDQKRLRLNQAGLYSFDFRLQVTSTNSSNKNIFIWARVNGVDVNNSATKITLLGNDVEIAPSWNFVYSMKQNDYFELMYACTDTNILINAPTSTTFCPSTPSAVIKVTQIDL